jgi:hypothetical protein
MKEQTFFILLKSPHHLAIAIDKIHSRNYFPIGYSDVCRRGFPNGTGGIAGRDARVTLKKARPLKLKGKAGILKRVVKIFGTRFTLPAQAAIATGING